jgi:cobalt/nickel transport protein
MNGRNDERGEYRLTGSRRKWTVLALLTLAAAGLMSPWASGSPDGLERVAEDLGFVDREAAIHALSPMPDYEVAGIPWEAVRVGLAGLIGAVVMAAVLWAALRALSGKNRQAEMK